MTEQLIPERPHVHDADISKQVAEALLPQAIAYCEEENDDDGEILKQLTEVLEDSHEFDGYKLARKLEDDHYWEGSEELVDLMGSAGHYAYKACRAAVEAWVKKYNIKPGHKVDDKVTWNRFAKFWREEHVGTIVEIREAEGVYVIQEEGKDYGVSIPKGLKLPEKAVEEMKKFKGGFIVPYEQVDNDQPWWTPERHKGKKDDPVGSSGTVQDGEKAG